MYRYFKKQNLEILKTKRISYLTEDDSEFSIYLGHIPSYTKSLEVLKCYELCEIKYDNEEMSYEMYKYFDDRGAIFNYFHDFIFIKHPKRVKFTRYDILYSFIGENNRRGFRKSKLKEDDFEDFDMCLTSKKNLRFWIRNFPKFFSRKLSHMGFIYGTKILDVIPTNEYDVLTSIRTFIIADRINLAKFLVDKYQISEEKMRNLFYFDEIFKN